MASFEKIFRPFALPDTTPPRLSRTQPPGDNSPVILVMGKGGGTKVLQSNYSASYTCYHGRMEAERTDQ